MKSRVKKINAIRIHLEKNPGFARYFYVTFSASSIFFISLTISKIQSIEFEHTPYENSLSDIIARTLFAPTIEAVIFQLIPFQLAKRWHIHPLLSFSMMTVPFACAHHYLGIIGIFAAFLAGIILAFSFIFWSSFSLRQGFFITASIHILHNFLAELWNNFMI